MHNMYASRRKQAEQIWWAGVEAVQPRRCLPAAFSELADMIGGWLPQRHYLIIGGGKAGAAMAQAAETELLRRGIPSSQITGWVNVPEGSTPERLNRIHLHHARPAGYNFPTPQAVQGTAQMLQLLDDAPEDAVVLCLISGGGSAILCAPVREVPLDDKIQVSKQLSAAGASIGELNAVRKHLSLFKGGRLAQRCFGISTGKSRRHLASLIISDVIGDPLDVIASGPTAVDSTTYADALEVLRRKNLLKSAPASVINFLTAGVEGKHAETLKSYPVEEPWLAHRVIANNQLALESAARKAQELGYQVINLGDQLEGDTLELADRFVEQLPSWRRRQPVCVLSGGETTVRLPSNPGKGGRNQSCALAMACHLQKQLQGLTLLCAGTDGEDGPTDAAGAYADLDVWIQSEQKRLDPQASLGRQDAYPFFDLAGGLFRTGLTETNVMDLRVFLLDPVDP